MLDWKEIDEKRAKRILKEIYENLDNDNLLNSHSEALEKRYRKPQGTISGFIFYDELSIEEILAKLHIDDVTYL